MATLQVELQAKIDNLIKELNKAKNALKETGDEADDTEKKLKKGEQGFKNTKKSVANVTPTLLEFNRTIQDAPFGIQGVANNLTQLTQNFNYLREQTGGTVSALKALVGGFVGPAGILFAVSALTSLLVVYGDKLKLTSGFTKDLAKVSAEFVASAQSEIEALRNLIRIASDENQSKKTREGAIDRINSKYGEYLGNLNTENIKTKEVKASIDALTNSLVKQAQVRGIQALIEEKYKDSAEDLVGLQLEQKEAAKAVKAEVDRLRGSVAAFNNVSKDLPLTDQIKQIQNIVNNAGGSGSGQLRVLSNLIGQFNGAVNATREFTSDFDKELDPLREILSDATISDLFNELSEIEGITITPPKIDTSKFKNTFKNLDDVFGINKAVQRSLDSGEGTFQAVKIKFDQFGNTIVGALENTGKMAVPALSVIEQALKDFNDNASEIIQNGIVNTFNQLGQAIGGALVEGGNLANRLGAALLGSVGSMLTQLGELAIQTGIGILAVQTALKSLNPYVAIAAGVALVAIGSAFSSGARNIGSSGSSGSSFSGQSSSSSSFGGSSGSASSGFGDGRVVFEISGQKLIGVLENTKTANLKLGGNVS